MCVSTATRVLILNVHTDHNNEKSTHQEELAKYLYCNIVTFFCEVMTKGIHCKTQFQGNSNQGNNRVNCGCRAKGGSFENEEG